MGDKRIRAYVEWINSGKIKHKPFRWGEDKDDEIFAWCPVCGTPLEWSYSAGNSELNEYEVYDCEPCNREWTSGQLMDADGAWKVVAGENPHAGAIFVQTDSAGDQTFYTSEWNFDEPADDNAGNRE